MRDAAGVATRGALVATLVVTSACSAPKAGDDSRESREDGRTGSVAAKIINGTVDTTRPDVLLLQDDTLAGFRCTVTLIAPNLVITARHCVGKRAVPAASALCQGDATTDGATSLPVYDGDAPAMPMYVSAAPGAPLLARAMTIYDDGAPTTCAHDLALIALDWPLTGITPSAIRRVPLAVGDALVPMGFGWIDRNATMNATERMKGTTHVLALGPVVYAFQPLGDPMAASASVAVATGEIAIQGVTMAGDSGGPAFDASGAIAAVISRGYPDALYGPGTLTTLAAHLATIDDALAATGNAAVDTLPEGGSPSADAGADAEAPDPGAPRGLADAAAGAAPSTPDASTGCTVGPGGARSTRSVGAAASFALACAVFLVRLVRPRARP